MALRVLLADESVTIKKVIQLALQDFAVEVKAVPVGLDVLEVSKSFQPDLVFADILLQKRSGYEVCGDLKKDPQTAAIPVVLMWSSFMELDQRQVDACGADGRLEKPFEVEALRKLVLELVPRTRSQRLAHFLDYPSSVSAPLRNDSAASLRNDSVTLTTTPKEAPAASPKPRMPPPLAPAPRAAPKSNPFGTSLGAPVNSNPTAVQKTTPHAASPAAASVRSLASLDLTSDPPPTNTMDYTPTPGIPDRPAAVPLATQNSSPQDPSFPRAPSPDELRASDDPRPLGALPDLQLEGQGPQDSSRTTGASSSGGHWNMDSFEPLDLAPLSLDDDDGEQDAFQPIQLPQAEPSPSPLSIGSTLGAALSLTNDDDDAEADQWANKSLDKYRLAPLRPDESLAVDDMTPDFAVEPAIPRFDPPPPTQVTEVLRPPEVRREPVTLPQHGRFELDPSLSNDLTTDKTEIIQPGPKKRPVHIEESAEELPEFSLSDDDFDHTSRLEMEHVDLTEKTRPEIVRELLRDPDFSYGEQTVRRERNGTATSSRKTDRFERTMSGDGVIDLSSAGEPPVGGTDNGQLEAMVRDQVAPQLEKVIERIVAQLLPQIAERIIKRELERLLEES